MAGSSKKRQTFFIAAIYGSRACAQNRGALTVRREGLSPFLGAEPAFGDLVAAGQHIILVAAGDVFASGELHPPALGLFALQECGLYRSKGGTVFDEEIPVR